MKDQFSDLGRDLSREIGRTVGRVLGSGQLADLGRIIQNTIQSTTRTAADSARRSAQNAQRARSNGYWGRPPHRPYPGGNPPHGPFPGGPPPHRPFWRGNPPPYRGATPPPPPRPAPAAHPPVRRKPAGDTLGMVWIVLGFIGAIPTGLIFLAFLSACFTAPHAFFFFMAGLFLVLCAAFGYLIGHGFSRRRCAERFAQYQKIIHGKTYCSIADLAAATGRTPAYVVKDLKKMVRLRMFQEGYFDQQETCFILDYETYQQYLKTEENVRRQKEEEQQKKERLYHNPEQAAVEDLLEEGKKYVQTIRQINDDLPEEEISQKLDALEDVTSKIFAYVEQHPEKLPQIRKFMCYYLPTTMKLMEAYRDLEQNGVDTQEVQETKRDIKEALDNINRAFQNLFNNLVQNDLLDVSSNISALETMFAQEGLSGNQDFDSTLR